MREISSTKQESGIRSLDKLIRSRASRGKPKLIVLCGPSHAGKTTFARRLQSRFRIVSSDSIRKELAGYFDHAEVEVRVWKVFEAMKRQALKEHCNVIIDACHISTKARRHALEGPNERHSKLCIVFDLPLRAIRKRCLKEKRLPLREVERMWAAFQDNKPTGKELRQMGFDEVYFIK